MKKGYLRIALAAIIFIAWVMFLESSPDVNSPLFTTDNIAVKILLYAICLLPGAPIAMLIRSGIRQYRSTVNGESDDAQYTEGSWVLVVFGLILVTIQILVTIKGIKTNTLHYFENVTNLAQFLFDLLGFLGFSLVGIIGIALMIAGLPKRVRK